MKISELGLDLRNTSPDMLEALAQVIVILNGGQIDDRPIHPVTGERLDYPLTNEQCAAINHSQIARDRPQDMAGLQCDCSFCRQWRRTRRKDGPMA